MSQALAATVVLAAVAAVLGGMILAWRRRLRSHDEEAVEQLNAVLPQTQCAQCGFPGCRPYAQALLAGEAEINRCPPGGEAAIRALAQLLGRPPLPLAADLPAAPPPQLAVIDEARCIGCTLCIRACPVDAIVGAQQFMHTVIAAECTGCELCIPACPVDCIDLVPAVTTLPAGARLQRPTQPAAHPVAARHT